MKQVGSTDQNSIPPQFDRMSNQRTRRYYSTGAGDAIVLSVEVVEHLGEIGVR